MPEDTPTPKPKRSKRRDFARIIRELEAYVAATIDILESQPVTEFGKGTIAFAKNVLERIRK